MAKVIDGIDVTQMETTALRQAKLARAKQANEILSGHKGTDEIPADEKAKARAFLSDCDILEQEITRRAEDDGLRTSATKHLSDLMNGSTMPDGDNGIKVDQKTFTPGGAFVESDIYQKLKESGAFLHEPESGNLPQFGVAIPPQSTWAKQRNAFNEKTLIYSSTGGGGASFVIPSYDTDVESLARPGPDILDLLRVVPAQGDTIIWMQQQTRSTAATAVSQATALTGTVGTKPESALAWTRVTTPIETIAVWVAATNNQLNDAPELRALIDDELTFDLFLQLDYQILQGSGTAPNLRGILNTSGVQSVAFATANGNVADNIFYGITAIATANEPPPNGVVMNPLDWFPVRTLKTSGSGEYIMGPPTMSGPTQLWGVPLVISNRMLENTALVGNFQIGARLHMREDAAIKVGMVNDDFINNRVRILAELRAGLTVRRPAAFCKVTGI